jgi:uncharacterized metal-binding protein
MATGCCGAGGETLVFTCAGAAYCGQVANRAGVQLAEQGTGQLFCLAAIGGRVEAKMDRARQAEACVAIDGCEDHCARKTLELAGLTVEAHVVLSDMGIEKKPAQPNMISDAKRVVERVRQMLGSAGGRTSCCGQRNHTIER